MLQKHVLISHRQTHVLYIFGMNSTGVITMCTQKDMDKQTMDDNFRGRAMARRAHEQGAVRQAAAYRGAGPGKGAEERQPEAEWLQGLVDLLPGHARLDGDVQVIGIDLDDAVEPRGIDDDRVFVA